MIQDIAPHRLGNQFETDAVINEGDWLFICADQGVLCRVDGGRLELPRVRDARRAPQKARFLFRLDGTACWLGAEADAPEEGYEFIKPGALRGAAAGPRELIFAAWTGYQLYAWYRDNAFCGRCATRTEDAPDERALVCPTCGRRIYPRIIPAVIVGVTDGDRILMTRYAGRAFTDWALVAGFTEIGETLEQTVAREVMEETGLRVKNIRYYKSQPWGIVDDLLAGFYCDVDGDTRVTLDEKELKEAVWTHRRDIQGQRSDYSLTNEMMLTFRDGREPGSDATVTYRPVR